MQISSPPLSGSEKRGGEREEGLFGEVGERLRNWSSFPPASNCVREKGGEEKVTDLQPEKEEEEEEEGDDCPHGRQSMVSPSFVFTEKGQSRS